MNKPITVTYMTQQIKSHDYNIPVITILFVNSEIAVNQVKYQYNLERELIINMRSVIILAGAVYIQVCE